MKPASSCVGGSCSRTLVAVAPRSSRHDNRRMMRSAECSASSARGGSGKEEDAASTTTSQSPAPASSAPPRPPPPDPEKRWRRLWGGNPHGVYRVPGVSDWFARAPQVRVRSRTDRQLEQLADLAVVNERLAGGSGPQARARVDFLRGRRRLWARVYDVVTRSDVGATLGEIERATGEVRGALEARRGSGDGGSPPGSPPSVPSPSDPGASSSPGRHRLTERERLGVSALRERLVSLQEQLREATERIESSRVRLSHNEERLISLKAAQDELEAALSRAEGEGRSSGGGEGASRAAAGAAAAAAEASSADEDARSTTRPAEVALLSTRGTWFPLVFLSELDRKNPTMIPLDVDGAPWVLYRTGLLSSGDVASDASEGGRAGVGASGVGVFEETAATTTDIACIRDECAHRACPLSLGTVDAAGRAVCPYHGWTYDGATGACVEMPSTLHRRGVGVEAMKVGVRDGVAWGWRWGEGRRDGAALGSSSRSRPSLSPLVPLVPPSPPPASAATPDGYVVVAEATSTSSTGPEELRAALAAGGAYLARGVPESAAARGLLPPPMSSSLGSIPCPESTPSASASAAPPETFDDGVVAVVTLTRAGKSWSTSRSVPRPPTLRLVHLVAPSKDGGSRLLLRVCVADGGSGAEVHGSGKRRLWAALAAEAVGEDAKLGGEGKGGGEGDGGVSLAVESGRAEEEDKVVGL